MKDIDKNRRMAKLAELFHKYIMLVIVIVAVISGSIATVYIMKHNDDPAKNENKQDSSLVQADKIYLAMYEPSSFNPLASDDEDVVYLNSVVYASMFRLDENLNVIPDIVSSYSTNKEDGTVQITIKDDAAFSDGSDLNAYDIEDTIDNIISIGTKSPYYIYASKIDSVYFTDRKNVTISFKSPDDAALDNLIFPIVSASEYSTSDNGFSLSSGKYMFSDYKTGQGINLIPSPNYKGNGKPLPVEITFVNDKSKIPGLMTMDAVVGYLNKSSDLSASDKDIKQTPLVSNDLEFIGFNYRNANLAQAEFRGAAARAIDREKIVEEDYGTKAVISDSLYYPGFLGSSKEDTLKFEPKEAAKLLSSLGYKDTDGDGILEYGEAHTPVVLRLLVASGTGSREEAAMSIAEALSSIGIDVKVDKQPADVFMQKIKSGDFDIFFSGMKIDKQFNLRELFGSSIYIGLNDQDLASKVASLEKALTPEEQKSVFSEVKSLLDAQMPYFPICYRSYSFLSVETLEYSISPQFFSPYEGLDTWSWKKRTGKNE